MHNKQNINRKNGGNNSVNHCFVTRYYVFVLVWMFDQLWINCKLTASQPSKFILMVKMSNKRHEEMLVCDIYFLLVVLLQYNFNFIFSKFGDIKRKSERFLYMKRMDGFST